MPGGGGVEVQESGRALKVHTDSPHLVSLGGGRLSTAVTLHPLPEGRRTLGSGPGADLQLTGTGVDSVHCHIDNNAGVVTLHPVSGSTAIDGLQVTQSTRLLQGCMICLGRSTCLRFNHPAEARFMKSVLPNSRISMMPFPFYPGEETSMFGGVEGKPPPAPRRSGGSQDSWGDLSSASSEDLARLISPKVFPPGSSTVNSPACVVLGSRPGTPSKLSAFNKSGIQSNGETKFTLPLSQYDSKVSLSNGNKPQNGSIYQNVIQLPNGRYTPSSGVESNASVQSPASSRVTSTSSPCPSSSERGTSPSPTRPSTIRTYPPPSPVFDQQYSNLTSSDRGSSPCPYKPVPSRPLASPSPAFDRNPSYPRKSVTSPTLSWDSSVEDLTSRKDELEKKRKQAQSDRVVAQEAEKMEQLRLEEILTMCADYEKQVQWEKQNKPQQNRIKTNGSLPRDKRLACSPSSPQMHKTFTFDSSDVGGHALESPRGLDTMDRANLDSPSLSSVDGVVPSRSPHTYENITFSYPSSPRTRIKTILPSKDNSRCEYSLEVIENRLAILNDFENISPRLAPSNIISGSNHKSDDNNDDSIAKSARVPTSQTKENEFLNSEKAPSLSSNHSNMTLLTSNLNVNGNSCQEDSNNLEKENNVVNISDKLKSRAEELAKSKYEFLGFDPRKELEMPNEKIISNLKRNISNSASSLAAPNMESSLKNSNDERCNDDLNPSDDVKSNNDDQIKTSSLRKLKRFDTCPSWTNPILDLGSYSSVNKNNGEYTTEQLLSQLDSIVRGVPKSPASLENGKFILPLPDSPKEGDSRSELVASLTKLKAKVTDVEQQQEELMRALEMEQALLHGEWEAQNEKLKAEDSKLITLREKMQQCDKEMERCADEQAVRQKQSQAVLEKHQTILNTLEQQLQSFGNDDDLKSELIESLRQQQELLDAEKKSFEDLEFSLLEEEARMLSYREELGREVSEINSRCTERRERMEQLELQREATEQQASSNSHQLQLERLSLLRQIEEIRGKLKELDTQKRFQIHPNSRSLDIYDQEGESVKKQSQDDLDRISRVTSGAPMEVSTNSLGRRAIASLQEIERNRQIHLAKQGSLVIEEERKRVSELKRRVQDEARAEWEERRQREHNCHSLNSVGSDESSLTSSDVHTESASSEDVEKRLPPPINEDKAETVSTDLSEQRDEREKEPSSRPVSDASSYSSDQLTVRLRNKSNSNIQRPLTRYLPIRGESLDLRQHIESAGHQIDLCPHVIIDKTSCRGYLQKMTSRFHQWNKRWFVFDRTRRTLTYYSDRSEKKPKGGAFFQAIEEVYVDHLNSVKSPNPEVPVTFVIKSSNKTYHLVAPSPEAMRIWVDVIFTGAEGYQEFCLGT